MYRLMKINFFYNNLNLIEKQFNKYSFVFVVINNRNRP